MKIKAEINVQDEVINLYEANKEKYSFNHIEEMIAYAIGLGIQQIKNETAGQSVLDCSIGVDEASKILGLTPGTVKNYCAEGKVKAKKIGKTWIIDKSQL